MRLGNHVSVFLVTLRLSCLPFGKPLPTYPSHHQPTARLLAYQHTWFCLFFSLYCRTNHLICSKVFLHQSCFYFSPLGLVTHFSLFTTLFFSPSWLPSTSLLLCLLVVVVRSFCLTELPVSVCWLWVGLKGWVCLPSTPCEGTKVSKAHTLSTIHQTWVHARRPFWA